MQFTHRQGRESIEKDWVPAITPFEQLIKKIKTRCRSYELHEGQTLTEEDYECIVDLQKLKQIQKAVVKETYVDEILAY